MSKCLAFILLFFVFGFSSKKEEKITWSPEYKLRWKDFLGKPKNDEKATAVSNIAISDYYKNQTDNRVFLDIKCEFNRYKSWVKKDQASDLILRHEQYHFNLGEVYSRILKKRVLELNSDKHVNKKQYDAVYEQLISDHWEMQNEYDDETDCSINENQQKKWEQKIDSLLLVYEKYSTYKRIELKFTDSDN